MKRVLVTGMSGVGKTSVLEELRRRGYKAVDADYDGLSEFDENGTWEWNESLVQEVLSTEDAEVMFFSGTSSKMRRFLPLFDHVVLLSAPAEVMVERLRTRTNNPYGQRPEEIAESLHYKETIEPILRTMATIEIDTTPALLDVVAAVLAHVEPAVAVRPARSDDAPAVARIWHDGWGDGHLGNVPDELVAARTWESFESRAVHHVDRTTVAVVGDVVVGFVMVVDDDVEQVYVATDHRGTGIAGVLLTEAERLVGASGHQDAWLAVVAGNARARRFYERSGWRDAGTIDHAAEGPDGPIAVPAHRYVKRIDSPTHQAK